MASEMQKLVNSDLHAVVLSFTLSAGPLEHN